MEKDVGSIDDWGIRMALGSLEFDVEARVEMGCEAGVMIFPFVLE